MSSLVLWELSPLDTQARRNAMREFLRQAVRGANPVETLCSYVSCPCDEERAHRIRAKKWLEELTSRQRHAIKAEGVFEFNLGTILWTPLHCAVFLRDDDLVKEVLEAEVAARVSQIERGIPLPSVRDNNLAQQPHAEKENKVRCCGLRSHEHVRLASIVNDLRAKQDHAGRIPYDLATIVRGISTNTQNEVESNVKVAKIDPGEALWVDKFDSFKASVALGITDLELGDDPTEKYGSEERYRLLATLLPSPPLSGAVIETEAERVRDDAIIDLTRFCLLHAIVLAELALNSSNPLVFVTIGIGFGILIVVWSRKRFFDEYQTTFSSSPLTDSSALPTLAAASVMYLLGIVVLKVVYFQEGIDFSLMFLGLAMFFNDILTVVQGADSLTTREGRRRPGKPFAKEDALKIQGFGSMIVHYTYNFLSAFIVGLALPSALIAYALFACIKRRVRHWLRRQVKITLKPFEEESPSRDAAENALIGYIGIWAVVIVSDVCFTTMMMGMALYSRSPYGAANIPAANVTSHNLS